MSNKKNVHVVPHGDKWAVKTEGNTRATAVAATQTAATAAARQIAIKREGEVFIHRPNGQIRDRNSYGNDPESSLG
jgi:hypothetical protein